MLLFISGDLWKYRDYQIKLEKVDASRTKLIIPNFKKDSNNYKEVERLEFFIPVGIKKLSDGYENIRANIFRARKSAKGYTFETELKNSQSNIAYALLHYDRVVEAEIYIPESMKEHVEVLQKIEFYDVEPDYGQQLVRIYLVKIKVPKSKKTIPFYLSWRDGMKYLDDHLVFYDNGYGNVGVKKCTTHIYLERSKRDKYIPLSDL